MQFRTSTLFVIVTTMGVVLASTNRSPGPLRLALLLCVCLVWLGFGLASSALRRGADQRPRYVVLCLVGLALASAALGFGVVLAGMALKMQFGATGM